MSIRLRLTLVAAAAVAIAVTLASFVMYAAVREELAQQTDQTLSARAAALTVTIGRFREPVIRLPPLAPTGSVSFRPDILTQIVDSRGSVLRSPEQGNDFPATEGAKAAAARASGPAFEDLEFEGARYRVLTIPIERGVALQLVRPLAEVDRVLEQLRLTLAAVLVGGVLVATALGLLVTRAAMRPIGDLTRAVEGIARTRDLSQRVAKRAGRDELARLATSFDSMLAALEDAVRARRQLVSDASHELRTPIASLRTNIELLARDQPSDPAEREQLLGDVVGQLERLSRLVADLTDLARDEELPPAFTEISLDEAVARAVDAARRNWPEVSFRVTASPSSIVGDPARIERALTNLLDNAAKFGPPAGTVDVTVDGGEVVVRDHGPGVAAADAPRVFDRFWRSPAARGMPGSGLGLSIVRDVAVLHGGSVAVEKPSDGGALFRLRFSPKA